MGEIVSHAWRIYFSNFPALFGLALLSLPIQMLAGTIQDQASKATQANLIGLLFIPSIVVSMVTSSAVIYAANAAITGGRSEFGAAIDVAFSRLGAVISSFALYAVLTIASLIAFPYFAVRWTFQSQAVMIDGKRNWAALDASSSVVKARWWRTFGVLLFVLAPVITVTGLQSAPWALGLIPLTLLGLAFSVVMPYVVTAQTLLYYDLKARKQADLSTDRLSAPEQNLPG